MSRIFFGVASLELPWPLWRIIAPGDYWTAGGDPGQRLKLKFQVFPARCFKDPAKSRTKWWKMDWSVTRGHQQRLGFNIRRSVERLIRLGSWEDVIFADNLSHTELKFFFFFHRCAGNPRRHLLWSTIVRQPVEVSVNHRWGPRWRIWEESNAFCRSI